MLIRSVRGEGVVVGRRGIICAATVWPQWSVCGQLATTNLGEKAAASGWLKLASHRRHHFNAFYPENPSLHTVITTAGMHLFQCDDVELQQSFGQWDSLKVYKTGCDANSRCVPPLALAACP